MSNEMEHVGTMSVAEHKAQINVIQRVLREVMLKKVHYDKIPGCGEKTVLLKAGAEKILATFFIGVKTDVEDLSNDGEYRYRVTATGIHTPTGRILGSGIGECSSAEKKYAWREAVCDKEYENTPENKRQIYYKKGYKAGQFEEIKQVRANPADVANTVLKISKKRAVIDLCLSATACSDLFTQDLEETAEPSSNGAGKHGDETKPDATTTTADIISDAQGKRLFAILSKSSKSVADLKSYLKETYNIEHSREVSKANYESVINWIEKDNNDAK
jgi:hypothetical protein